MPDNEEQYHGDATYLTNSQLKVFSESHWNFYEQFVVKTMERKTVGAAAEFGKIVHAYCLQMEDLSNLVIEYPRDCYDKSGEKLTAKAARFRDEHPSKVCLKNGDHDRLLAVLEAIEASWIDERIQTASYLENTFQAEAGGELGHLPVAAKCKVDIAEDLGDRILVTDLKISDPLEFERSAKNYKYWLQDAHYSRILYETFGKPVVFEFAVVEPKYPFRIARRWYGMEERRMAYQRHQQLLNELRECYVTGDWTDVLDGEIPLSSWELGLQDDVQLIGAEEVD